MGQGPVAIMKYPSTRFGEFEVTDNEILNCPDGLYGFEQETQFALLPFDPNSRLASGVAAVTHHAGAGVCGHRSHAPFVPDYEVTLTAEDRLAIGLGQGEAFHTRVIVTVPEDYRTDDG